MKKFSPTDYKDRIRQLQQSTLLMNALYLMLSTFVIALSGFIFWVMVARTYDIAAVGLATTLLSVSGLLSLLGLAGFDTTFVRFLPRSAHKQDYINSGFVIVTGSSTLLAIGFAIALPIFSPRLAILRDFWPFVGFVFFTTVTSLNILTNAVFLALKQARYIFGINAAFSLVKVMLPLLLAQGNAITIFVLAGLAQLAGLVLSFGALRQRFGLRLSPKVHLDILHTIKRYSFSVYASSILNLLPPTLLPLIIIHRLGPENAAYYYMAFTIAGVLYTISYASMQSAFAEGSHDAPAIKKHIVKAARLVSILLVPTILLTLGLSTFILQVFGNSYAEHGNTLLQLFAVSALPVAGYSALGAIFKVTQNLRGVIAMNLVYAIVILSLSYLLIPRLGIVAIGWAWAVGNITAVGVGLSFLRQRNEHLI